MKYVFRIKKAERTSVERYAGIKGCFFAEGSRRRGFVGPPHQSCETITVKRQPCRTGNAGGGGALTKTSDRDRHYTKTETRAMMMVASIYFIHSASGKILQAGGRKQSKRLLLWQHTCRFFLSNVTPTYCVQVQVHTKVDGDIIDRILERLNAEDLVQERKRPAGPTTIESVPSSHSCIIPIT
jgi:hypothetical protein